MSLHTFLYTQTFSRSGPKWGKAGLTQCWKMTFISASFENDIWTWANSDKVFFVWLLFGHEVKLEAARLTLSVPLTLTDTDGQMNCWQLLQTHTDQQEVNRNQTTWHNPWLCVWAAVAPLPLVFVLSYTNTVLDEFTNLILKAHKPLCFFERSTQCKQKKRTCQHLCVCVCVCVWWQRHFAL